MNNDLKEKAKEVLNGNYQEEGFTIPSKNLYPFQWKWDSGFIALGYAHYDIEKAKKEIETILDAQWINGFIPHIVFHNDSDTYFPGPNFFKSELSPYASKKYRSSGITQPPVFGFVLEKIYEISRREKSVLEFIERQIEKVYLNHLYFYHNRDIMDEGLVYIYHNWESGTDNSPIWDGIWETINSPKYEFKRKDTDHVDASERPTKVEYNNYIHILEIAKRYNYDDKLIAENSPFLVQDPLFNSILFRSNEGLIKLFKLIGGHDEKINYLEEKQAKGIQSLNKKLFNHNLGAYTHYDLRNNKSIPLISSSSFTPMFCGAPDNEIVDVLTKTLIHKFGKPENYLCSSFDPTNNHFNPSKYWRGPIWINLNWMMYQGFKRYGYDQLAKRIRNDSIELVKKNGFYEYFDPRKTELEKRAYGGDNFSWTAALILDFILEK